MHDLPPDSVRRRSVRTATARDRRHLPPPANDGPDGAAGTGPAAGRDTADRGTAQPGRPPGVPPAVAGPGQAAGPPLSGLWRRMGRVDHVEKGVSTLGGIAGLLGVMLISQAQLGLEGAVALVASMGSSAVLLFAVPHGALSQPWSVFGGHLVSALIGIACALYLGEPLLAAPLAVGLSIGAMHYLNCIHPPGGATALGAVIGGDAIHELGFQFVVTPVMLNVLAILFMAWLFNLPFPWRRYPARLAHRMNRDRGDPRR